MTDAFTLPFTDINSRLEHYVPGATASEKRQFFELAKLALEVASTLQHEDKLNHEHGKKTSRLIKAFSIQSNSNARLKPHLRAMLNNYVLPSSMQNHMYISSNMHHTNSLSRRYSMGCCI